ncbi:Dynamitin-domain-containing protein [Diplogelasinospora grovesii]|uniref:Dynamitin-domain-containing protein n=1 Tax=Diplogelasinospora grovesii TaxID=303347 RepID=A0AAN6NAH6_9PEZI|nr:Dynamitin-domain-containing protein [Diplogelasinospora grovesii]
MASNRKYAALPDLDSAPDIYETPELTDDNSTVPPTTVRSPSDDEYDVDPDDPAVISRRRLRIDEARSRFMPASVDASDVDFSDRLNGKRKSYRASSRRQRILNDGTEELGDLSDEDDAESLARKIARLKREITEAKEEYGKQKAASKQSEADKTAQDEEIASLSKTLDEISRLDGALARTTTAVVNRAITVGDQASAGAQDSATYTVTYAPTYEQTHALAKAADFDRRLTDLEKALGVGSSAVPELDPNGLPRAVIPTLESLRKQILTLSEASTSSLDSISRRVRTLAQEADNLEKSRRNAKAAQEALASTGAGSPVEAASLEDSEQMAKINALYATIPTIENLTPLLPPLLDRLRSLRMIHADAATASETLARLEKRQTDMATDIAQWREGLEKVEAAMGDGEASMAGNMKVVEGWVKELEGRMAKLS